MENINENTSTKLNKKEIINYKIFEYYSDMINSYNNNVNMYSIENMIDEDYNAYKSGKQSNIKSEEDYRLLQIALSFIKTKLEYIEDHNKYKDTYFDKCIYEKEELQKAIDNGVSLENLQAMLEIDFNTFDSNMEKTLNDFSDTYNNPTVTKSNKDKEIKKLALNILKKENN